ncbi:thiamine-phosphate diphosphorylase [Elizabethkingia meningoseptica]|uniref:thiamine phosphate synthase n=1 Tax=Elizabethkingia meningoseptica TaxID=238 RepID=UPI000332D33C|nr:thiamine phosphate synthase [Elizabethkingia meningoseptica]AQX06598.1 thiamine-phosphate diphosphorylase [Elizabethkingia meningoseptica]AQX48645.1 thiamine-phosphate diphosphorylase [Elizabethkingia meningoseptica]EOR28648.1 thiamine-phosphate pyrophosphorylase [Elizabethkingia meningoseptica ATCC 13253 = NBRC 12535]KUY13699.1 thiamine-phosphate pyrophosphorylase [Elizabethkingia meningoseptica]MDE5488179.1 thiamine phosphate synthase [Elizabethkingia meningoseptica]
MIDRTSIFPYQLYLVISEEACSGKNFLDVAKAAILGGVDIIQLREKNCSTPDFLKKAHLLKEITDMYNVPLIINDNSEVALQVNTAGVHVGNNDQSPTSLRQHSFYRDKLIGYSIEYLNQLENEHTKNSDYLGISPVFTTATKTDTVTEWGLAGIEKIRALTNKPLVAIGNISVHNATEVIQAGADCLAVVSAICSAENPQEAAYQLKNKILK